MYPAHKSTTPLLAQLAHGLEVLAPIATANDKRGKRLAGKEVSRLIRFQEGTHRHTSGAPPGRGTNADQVVVAISHRFGGLDLTARSARLCWQHAQHVGPHMSHGEPREPLGKASIREFDLRVAHFAPPLAEHLRRGLEHFERLPGVRVVQEQDPRPSVAAPVISHRHYRTSSSLFR